MHQSTRARATWLNVLILAVVVIISVAGCSTPKDPDYVQVLTRSLNSGDELPLASGTKILTLSGGVIGSKAIDADTALLESLGTVKYVVEDPYENLSIEYEGVLIETLFDQFGNDDTVGIAVTAIDDYQQVISRADAEKWPIILAIKVDGQAPPRTHRGPSMIVYPYDSYPELDPSKYDPFWVWQIKSINFE